MHFIDSNSVSCALRLLLEQGMFWLMDFANRAYMQEEFTRELKNEPLPLYRHQEKNKNKKHPKT